MLGQLTNIVSNPIIFLKLAIIPNIGKLVSKFPDHSGIDCYQCFPAEYVGQDAPSVCQPKLNLEYEWDEQPKRNYGINVTCYINKVNNSKPITPWGCYEGITGMDQ